MKYSKIAAALVLGMATFASALDGDFSLKGNVQTQVVKSIANDSTNLNNTFTITTSGTYNLVFAWSNDASGGTQPPAAVDNVQIYRNTCPSPDNFHVVSNTISSITVDWTGVGTPTGYELGYSTTSGSPTPDTVVTSGPVTFNGLTAGQNYYFYIRTICENGSDSSMWVGPLSAVPGTWTMRPNYTDTLRMCGGVIYDDGGASGNYSNSQDSYIILYPDAPNNLSSVSGNYNLESCCDYISIYDGVGTSGTQLLTSSGTTSGTIPSLLSSNGPLTIFFHTDGSVNSYDGFTLNVSCVSTTCRVFNVRQNPALPASANELHIVWDTNGADYYEVAYGTPGFIPTTPAITTFTNRASISGLSGLTYYDVCVRSICNYGADTGSWTRVSFQTALCDNPGIAYSYDSTMSSTTSSYGPMGYSFYNYGYIQTLIDSAQMAGIIDPITAFAFNPSTSNQGDYYTHMTVYMANVPEANLSAGYIMPDSNHVFVPVITDRDMCYTSTGWQLHGFDTAFTWDGHSNVLFAVVRGHGSYSSGATFNAHSTSTVRTRYSYQDGSPYSPTNPSAGNTGTGNYVGDLQFISCNAAGCGRPAITGTSHTYHSATVTWTGNGNDYEVNIKESAAPDWPATDVAVSGTSHTFTGLRPATAYTFRVRQDCSADSLGYSDWVINGFVTDSLPCLTPDSLHATAVTNATADLDWNVNGNETNWDIHVWYSGGFDSTYRVSSRPATVGGFTAGVTYYAAIRALCGVNLVEGDWSDTVSFTTAVCPDVTGLSAGYATANSITLSWANNPMAQSWIIEYGLSGFPQGSGITATSTTNNYVVNGLTDETLYDFHVRAVCGSEWYSEGWASVSASTLSGGVTCDAPTNVTAAVADNSVTVNWTAGQGNISFELEYGPHGFAHGSGIVTSATTSPAVIPNLDYETQYDVYVHAICDRNTVSPWSVPATFTTGQRPSEDCPTSPTTLPT